MLASAKAGFAKALLTRLAKDNDAKTTLLGIAAAALLAAQLDFGKLGNGDSNELGKAAGAIVAALLGYYTNKKEK